MLLFVSAFWSLFLFFQDRPTLLSAPEAITALEAPTAVVNAPDELLSLEFVENKGQWPAQVHFAAETPAGKMFLESTRFVQVLHDPTPRPSAHNPAPSIGQANAKAASGQLLTHAYSVSFEGANRSTTPQGSEGTFGIRNYFIGNDSKKWGAGAKGFRKVLYKDLYQGVDMALYEQAGKLKYDLYLAAGSSPSQIKIKYEGASQLKLVDGHLVIETSVGKVTEHRPVAYQIENGQRINVPCTYQLKGQTLRFSFPEGYDKKKELIIDPVVEFSSFTGSTAINWGFTATYDSQGNMYSGGIAFSTGYPVSLGAYETSFNGAIDIAIIKYKTNVTGPAARLYATYLGGDNTEAPHSMVVNAKDELVILSSVGSRDFPTSATAFDRSFGGGPNISPLGFQSGNPHYTQGSDIAVTILSQDGSTLLASTYLGGGDNDGLLDRFRSIPSNPLVKNYGDQFRGDIITDTDGNIYLASSSSSGDFPTIGGLSNQPNGGLNNAVICKLSPSLDKLIWSTYYGGSGADAAYSIQLDKDRNVYVAGGTTSTTLPGTAGGLHPTSSGSVDGFVIKLSSTGDKVLAATFIGTAAYDQAYFLQLDPSSNVYLYGQTMGNYPVSAGVYSKPNSRQFIHKLTPDLSSTVFSTVFGSGTFNIDISPTAFLVDDCERIYISGWGGRANVDSYGNGYTTNLPVTPDALQSTTDGSDFYLMQLSAGALELQYATFYGGRQSTSLSGEHVDGGTSRFDKKGVIYQAVCGGCSGPNDFPVPPGAHYFSRENHTRCNNAAFKFNFEVSNAGAGPSMPLCVEAGPLLLTGSPAGGVWTGTGVEIRNGRYYFVPTLSMLGDHTLTYTVHATGTCTRSSSRTITVVPKVEYSFSGLEPVVCQGAEPVTLVGTPSEGTFKGPGIVGNVFNPALAGPGTHTITYSREGEGNCSFVSKQVQVSPTVTVRAGDDRTICTDQGRIQLFGFPGGGNWSGEGVIKENNQFFFSASPGMAGKKTLTYTSSGPCPSSDEIIVEVIPNRELTFTTLPPQICMDASPITLQGSEPNSYFYGQGVEDHGNGTATFYPNRVGFSFFAFISYASNLPCSKLVQQRIEVIPPPIVRLSPDTLICLGTTTPFQLRGEPAGGKWSGLHITPEGIFTPPTGFVGPSMVTYTTTSSNGLCTASASKYVAVAPLPNINVALANELCFNNPEVTGYAPFNATFSNATTGATSFVWDFGDGSQSTEVEPKHTYTQPGTYKVMLTTTYSTGCQDQREVTQINVAPNGIPNIITPNGDGLNDVFFQRFSCLPTEFVLYNRWGKEVHREANYRQNWDGGSLSEGTYFYLLKDTEGNSAKGWVEIVR
ncbi:DUF7948 domain-containing protein [Rufibacter roseus]|uniref:PKD domain-containing protein n=1 Tax=Rufibacter roseus TaxID=1567108 RepID=A0ABW2DLJ2_9BACT|nr:PKD domain-containing protein [Rufibacter roseus]